MRYGIDENVMWKRTFYVSGGVIAIYAWMLLVIATIGLVGMEIVGREHEGHSQEGLATQRDMPEHFLCTRWEHR